MTSSCPRPPESSQRHFPCVRHRLAPQMKDIIVLVNAREAAVQLAPQPPLLDWNPKPLASIGANQ